MSIDFDEIRERLGESLDRLRSGAETADVEGLLKERGRQFATLRLNVEERAVLEEVIVVRRSESTFALPVRSVVEVREVTVTRLPHRTRHIAGLFQLRGQVHCLVDVQPFVGPTVELDHGTQTLTLLVHGSQGTLGLRVDEILGPRTLYLDEMDQGHREHRLEFVRHVTRDCVEVIDVEPLLATSSLQMTGGR